jgi:hypothetical protein
MRIRCAAGQVRVQSPGSSPGEIVQTMCGAIRYFGPNLRPKGRPKAL